MIRTSPAAPAYASQTLAFRPEIEGLRALAVSFVVAYHAGVPGFPGGFIGVDVFFVISGYLISGLLIEEYRQSGRISFMRFYARRARRLLPAVFLMISVTMIAARFIVSPLEYRELGKSGIFAALSSSNIWFALNAANYFGISIRNSFLLHTWSLAVEEQFYLIWPTIIAMIIMTIKPTRRCIWVFATVVAVDLLACALMTKSQPAWAFYGTPFRIWEFGAGTITYLIRPPKNARTGLAFAYLGFALIVTSNLLLDTVVAFPGYAASMPVLGTSLVLYSCTSAPTAIPFRLLRTRPMQMLGTMSYSWYLWHWPFLTIGAIALSGPATPKKSIFLVVASFVAAWLSFIFVENPIRRNPALVLRNIRSLLLGAVLAFTATGGSIITYSIAKQALAAPDQLAIAHASRPPSDDCLVGFGGTSPHSCVFGRDDARKTIILFGDSHAHQWLSAIRPIVEQRRWRLVTFLKGACPTPDVHFYYYRLRREYWECEAWRNNAIKRIQALKPSVIFMVNSSMSYVRAHGSNRYLTYTEWSSGLSRTLDRLSENGTPKIILLRDNPRPSIPTLKCLSRASFHGQPLAISCVVDRSAAIDKALFVAERKAVDSHTNAHIIDLTDWFCTKRQCPTYRNGISIYRDGNHLSLDTVLLLRPVIERKMLAVISDGH